MKNKVYIILLTLFCACLSACHDTYVPKPRGYYRIAIPEAKYERWEGIWNETNKTFDEYPYAFTGSKNAVYIPRKEKGEKYWLDIYYPTFNVTIHCSYKPINNNLRELSDDAQEFVFNHATKASAIPEQGFANPDANVYGVFFHLMGNTASPFQFYLTDSTANFFRGAVYFNCTPNQDSLAPIIDYIQLDIRNLMESFAWQ